MDERRLLRLNDFYVRDLPVKPVGKRRHRPARFERQQRQLLVKLVNEPQFHAARFAAALAQAMQAALVTSDKGFRRVGAALKSIWV